MPKLAPTLLMFNPQGWGQVTKFAKLHEKTHSFTERDRRALIGVEAHFEKAMRLHRLADRLAPNIEADNAELEARGYTPAENAKEVATLIEAAILELYSSLDCTVKVLRAIYGANTRNFKESTRITFQNVERLSGTFPDQFKKVIREATWFGKLMRLRDDLTHLDTGRVHLDSKSGIVGYTHYGMKEAELPLSIENIMAWLTETEASLNSFIGAIFHHLNGNLSAEPVFQICGIVEGRLLHRYVNPTEDLNFNSGQCGAWVWFEEPESPHCPFAGNCGAYLRKAEPQG
jgi:hypothetical protein